ncbi:uncharacterized protein BO66DRAFT_393597 [Aspergillus aculeatinus CBS 121060]|uniref:Uncharacterized protein n=1 Tax=Aspergillus aculeatinus CBS 121060 TaxID=1448322 RepID=A0ACD1H236_9EURO|nr:hypothetical protein BO66DRAFT_393597 [Aspergillus aculeatinus CBS 121060]RAH67633.1 hypothetical protein BO66DRAFT_393597 [Aspergillus aculeatinus CBS 121060]
MLTPAERYQQMDHHPWVSDFHTDTKSSSIAISEFDPEADPERSQGFRRKDHHPPSLWMRGLGLIAGLIVAPRDKRAEAARPLLGSSSSASSSSATLYHNSSVRQFPKPRLLLRCLLYPIAGFLIMLGIVQFISIACGIVIAFFPSELDRATERWQSHSTTQSIDLSHWPTDASRDIIPVACHSHNDYWRPVPLFSAIQAGCIGVEADVWLFDEELYVGHTTSALTPKRTLRSLYIDPLLRVLEQQNPLTEFHPHRQRPLQGVFDTDPAQTLVLLIDIKTDGQDTWNQVAAQLNPLRERGYLTYFNGTALIPGPLTVVGTGNTPFSLVTANTTYRDIFFDAPLNLLTENAAEGATDAASPSEQQSHDQLPQDLAAAPAITVRDDETDNPTTPAENVGQGLSGVTPQSESFDWTNSYYASVSFKKSIGSPRAFRLSDQQIDRIRAQIRAAHRRGLRVRYWGLPSWPRSLRNHLWAVLVQEGVDILNVDDLQSATRQDWRPKLSDLWS